jgi:hypothetical protein
VDQIPHENENPHARYSHWNVLVPAEVCMATALACS